MNAEVSLRERFDDTIRQGLATQAKAYQEYGALLNRLASRDIKAVQFARDSADLYIGTMGKFASTGVKFAEQAFTAGVKGVGSAASATADAVEDGVAKATTRTKASGKGETVRKAKRSAKTKPAKSAAKSKA